LLGPKRNWKTPTTPTILKRVLKQLSNTFSTVLFREQRLRLGWRLLLFFSVLALVSGISLFPLVALFLTTWFMTRWIDRRPLMSVGLSWDRGTWRPLLQGLGLGAGLLLLIVLAIVVVTPSQLRAFSNQGQALSLLLVLFILHLSIALFEELLIRGYVLQTLGESLGAVPALLLTSGGFALLHLDNPSLDALAVLNLFLAGVVLGGLVLKTRSLWPAVGFHFAWNVMQGHGLGLPVSGVQLGDYVNDLALSQDGVRQVPEWLHVSLAGPAWLSGAAFGPEASLLTSIGLSAAAAWIWFGGWFNASAAARRLWRLHVPLRGDHSAQTSCSNEADQDRLNPTEIANDKA